MDKNMDEKSAATQAHSGRQGALGHANTQNQPPLPRAHADERLLATPPTSVADARAINAMASAAAEALRSRLPKDMHPTTLITLGSGLGDLAGALMNTTTIPYAQLPHMLASSAPGHAGQFVAGELEGKQVLCMQGRLHPYEGLGPLQVTFPLRVAAKLGVKQLIVTNATGAINASYGPGQVVAIADHINLTGTNPLIGANDESVGPRFPEMGSAYSPRLRALAQDVAAQLGYDLAQGVYLGLSGPAFETPAEIRAFRALGADLVGMSTVWEVILAAWLGVEVLGLSMVTNMAAGMLDQPISVDEINRNADRGARDMLALVRGVIVRM